jgi:hypothetical protein
MARGWPQRHRKGNLVYANYNQQDAAQYNIVYCCQNSTCFKRFLRPLSGAQKLYLQDLVFVELKCVGVDWIELA